MTLKGVYSISYKEKDKIIVKFETENQAISALHFLRSKNPFVKIQMSSNTSWLSLKSKSFKPKPNLHDSPSTLYSTNEKKSWNETMLTNV